VFTSNRAEVALGRSVRVSWIRLRRRELMCVVATVPSALQDFLKKLDGLLSQPGYDIEQPEGELSDDTTNIVRQFPSRTEM